MPTIKYTKWQPVLLLLFCFVTLAFTVPGGEPTRKIQNQSFKSGEKLHYRVHYGFINAAEATIDIDHELHQVNDRPCYKVNVFSKTTGSFDFFLRIRDTWRTYIDTTSIVPQKFFRNIEEGKYRKKETVIFDQNRHVAAVNNNEYKVPAQVQDIVSGFFYLRTFDFNRIKTGDNIKLSGFFDEELFNMDIVFKGRETIQTEFGNMKVLRLTPVLPKKQALRWPRCCIGVPL